MKDEGRKNWKTRIIIIKKRKMIKKRTRKKGKDELLNECIS
jgi:hypothetical protein